MWPLSYIISLTNSFGILRHEENSDEPGGEAAPEVSGYLTSPVVLMVGSSNKIMAFGNGSVEISKALFPDLQRQSLKVSIVVDGGEINGDDVQRFFNESAI
ncbi:MAG: hypothetical protein UW64_C0020G0006 [Microgenomates group bacterium GW2011_GWC1_44_37]|uniref:Uncharacterized protein n=1 Tax=Candidatus Collierbacteria bacterium GW2011_GWB2_44_22 TaxID=1618387 RepID=A0A0G1K3W7_9BACT|nr:MAG: hypothetical protein UW31_C0002G0076 [Candidatus Collierbacteria bacterium GW2011_GWA2_44_13]KKT49965.1 MAG: hypothetical protein UW42_C0028G0006 [Candidatus Collierbacteria bacterium GW2011_GWB1_44_197]KKT50957.1 MAG: hypothetical protein UW44_C0021G0003 [Candidatus Collierbacteria bacterium GW2011_GWB2_44_22]KKT62096.1 MAG: hypothetical protein UW56_C0012G0035 [Candidatus Collierbacteria bacterium GW2011_GWD1_44_27]KKT64793.1 MAG: hypothetical protein UW58_C0036G0003 [Candidatus Colli